MLRWWAISYDGPDGSLYSITLPATDLESAERAAEELPNGRVEGEVFATFDGPEETPDH